LIILYFLQMWLKPHFCWFLFEISKSWGILQEKNRHFGRCKTKCPKKFVCGCVFGSKKHII